METGGRADLRGRDSAKGEEEEEEKKEGRKETEKGKVEGGRGRKGKEKRNHFRPDV